MISDGQRREIAANLSSESESWRDTFPDAMIEEEAIGAAIMSDLVLFVGLDDSSPVHETYARLADLIDRPACRKVIPDEMEGYVFCSECGAEIGEYGVPNFCHSCGAEVER